MLCKLIEFGLCKVAKMKYFGVKKDWRFRISIKPDPNTSRVSWYVFFSFIVLCCSCCVPLLKGEIALSIATFQSSESFNVLSLGCVPLPTLQISLLIVVSGGPSRSLCMFQSILCSNTAYKSPNLSHQHASWSYISILHSRSLYCKACLKTQQSIFSCCYARWGGCQTQSNLRTDYYQWGMGSFIPCIMLFRTDES